MLEWKILSSEPDSAVRLPRAQIPAEHLMKHKKLLLRSNIIAQYNND